MAMLGRLFSRVLLGRTIGSILIVGSLGHPDGSAQAGRNRDGALVLHANDAYSYSASSACTPPQGLPTACADAITRTDRSTGSVIWLMAAFPDTSIPSVTTIYFGIDYTTERLTPARWKMCGTPGSLEVPDADWPYAGFGNAVAFPEPLLDQHLFAFYCFEIDDAGAADAGEDANPVFSTSINPTGGYAAFVDGSNPPVTDTIDRFGSVHWYEAGSNSCPVAAPENPGDGPDSPVDITPTNGLSIWLRPEWIPRGFHDARSIPIDRADHLDTSLREALQAAGAMHVTKTFPTWEPGENLRPDRKGEMIRIPDLSGFFQVSFADAEIASMGLSMLQAHPAVRFVEFDGPTKVADLPTDPYFEQWGNVPDPQWHLNNTGQRPSSYHCPAAKAGFDLHVAYVPSYPSDGYPFPLRTWIGMVDTGILDDHPDLEVLSNDRYQNHPGQDWCHLHGTRMSGFAAAHTNNDEGVAGMCGTCGLIDIEASKEYGCDCENHSGECEIVAGWLDNAEAAAENAPYGLSVLNLSVGPGDAWSTASGYMALWGVYARGVAIVAACGDEFDSEPTNMYPQEYPFVLGVGGYTHDGRLWVPNTTCYSERPNNGTRLGPALDVCAPACPDMLTTDPYGYNITTGQCSAACAIVSGAMGHLQQMARNMNPQNWAGLSADDLTGLIESTATPWGDLDPAAYAGCPSCLPSHYGRGRVNFELASEIVGEGPESYHGYSEGAFVKGGAVRYGDPEMQVIYETTYTIGNEEWEIHRVEAEISVPSPPVAWANLLENCRGDSTTTRTGFEPNVYYHQALRIELAKDKLPGCAMTRNNDGTIILTGYNYKSNLTGWLVPLQDLCMAYTYYTKGNTAVGVGAADGQALRLGIAPNPTDRQTIVIVRGNPGEAGVIDVYDVGGRLVDREEFRCGPDGQVNVTWDARSESKQKLTNGIYFLTARSARGITMTRVTIIEE